MKYSARTRSPRLSAALLPLLFAPVPALLAQNASALVAVPGDVRALLRDAQAACLPSASAVTQDVGAVFFAPADPAAAAWFAAVGDGEAFAFEDPATDETVVTNPASGGAARVAPEDGYNPNFFFLVAGYDVVTNADLLPFYDPSLVVLSLSLVPSNTVGAAANAAAATNSLVSGWLASFHKTEASLSALPDFAALPADLWLSVPAIDFPNASAAWSGTDSRFRENFAARFSGSLWIETPGDYVFHLASDDGAALWIDGAAVVLDDAPHSYRTRSATVALSAGLHEVVVAYYENTGTAGLRLSWTPPGGSETVVPASAVLHAEPAPFAPGVRLAAPDPAVCYVGNEVSLSATAWGFGETISRVDFFADDALVASVSNAPFSAMWETAATGTVAVSAIATDSAGAVSIPARRTVEVLPCPPGYAAGLSSTYYALSSRPGDLPDFSLLTPCQTRIEHSINHTEATSWPGVLVSATRLFASRHAGRLFVPTTGDWTFLLESAEGSRLYLDGALVVDNGGAHTRRTRSGTVRLAYGFHDFEVLHFTQGAPPTLRLHWQLGSASWTTIPQTRYFRAVGETDADHDGAEDWWETEFGFDPIDPADAALDPDSDGLSNLAEFLAGTNPLLADTDGDGIADAWEVARGLNPCLYSDAFADPDGDGLISLSEYRAGTDPNFADTDGDGVTDAVEVLSLHSDPLVADLDGTFETVSFVSRELLAGSVASGAWMIGDDGSAVLLDRAGELVFDQMLSAPADGVYRIAVGGRGYHPGAGFVTAEWDGEPLPVSECMENPDGTYLLLFDPPALEAGPHDLSLFVHCVFNAAQPSVASVELLAPGGAGWAQTRSVFSRTAVSGAVSSKASPYCLRGTAPSFASVSTSPSLPVKPLPSCGWWTDVPLDPEAPVSVSVSFEKGAPPAAVSVSWDPFHLLYEDGLTLRAGDSLLVEGSPDAPVSLAIAGVTNLVVSAGERARVRFPDSGEFSARVSAETNGQMVVRSIPFCVERADLGGCVAAWRGRTDRLELPGSFLGDAVIVTEPDLTPSALVRTAEGAAASVAVPDFTGFRAISVELPDGRVLDSAEVQGFKAFYSVEGVYHVKRRLPDGTRVIDVTLRTFNLPLSVRLGSSVYNAGTCFESGASSVVFEPDDYSWTGETTYTLFADPATLNPCHYLWTTHR